MAQPKVSTIEALEELFKAMAGPPDTRPEIPEDGCIVCAKPSKTLCGRCKAVHYCSSGCQREDFKLHSQLCKGWTEFLAARPTDHHRLIIYLPQDELEPSLRWLSCQFDFGTKEFDYDHLDLSASIMPRHTPEPEYIRGNKKRGYKCPIDKNAWLFYDSDFVFSGLPANKCIFALTDGDIGQPWAGPLVIMGRTNNANEVRDADLGDFRLAIDHLKARNVLHLKASSPLPVGYIRAVKITSPSDQSTYGWAPYINVAVHSRDGVFHPSQATKPNLPALLGLPLLLRDCQQAFSPVCTHREGPIPGTGIVMVPVKQEHKSDDVSVFEWRSEKKTHIVARQDRRTVTVRQVKALSAYAKKLQSHKSTIPASALTPAAFELFESEYDPENEDNVQGEEREN